MSCSDAGELIGEIRRAEDCILEYAEFYHSHESECPASFKLLMLINGWRNPFVALNELLKVIDKNEMLLKRIRKRTGEKTGYRSRYREMAALVQMHSNRRRLR